MTDLEILRADLAGARLPGSKRRLAVLAMLAAATLTAAAFAADRYLGEPAPAHVQASFARLGGWQRVGAVNAKQAKVVAFSRHTVLYGAPKAGGGTCLELLGDHGFEYEVLCDDARHAHGILVFGGIPVHLRPGKLPPVAVSGRIGADVATLEARVGKHVQRVRLGLDGFFDFEPSLQAAARRGELWLVARDRAGSVRDRVHVPAQLALDSVGTPPRVVHGVTSDPRAKRVFYEIWAFQSFKDEHCKPKPCGPGIGQTGLSGSTEVAADGSFSFAPKSPYKSWWVYLNLLDARFIPLDQHTVDGWPVPDASYWRRAAQATR